MKFLGNESELLPNWDKGSWQTYENLFKSMVQIT